mmetsp:Transcript_101357/g.295242  ORF Transcript_101357/g.295242 Transcript_101357/m.295242 type:complete len:230 (-) Transcript_101357:556-1245(-)
MMPAGTLLYTRGFALLPAAPEPEAMAASLAPSGGPLPELPAPKPRTPPAPRIRLAPLAPPAPRQPTPPALPTPAALPAQPMPRMPAGTPSRPAVAPPPGLPSLSVLSMPGMPQAARPIIGMHMPGMPKNGIMPISCMHCMGIIMLHMLAMAAISGIMSALPVGMPESSAGLLALAAGAALGALLPFSSPSSGGSYRSAFVRTTQSGNHGWSWNSSTHSTNRRMAFSRPA